MNVVSDNEPFGLISDGRKIMLSGGILQRRIGKCNRSRT